MKKHKQNTKTHKVAKIVGLSFLGLVILLIAFLFWALAPRSTKDIERVASMFVTPSGWKETRYEVYHAAPICISDIPCPNVDKRWEADNVTKEDVYKFIQNIPEKPDLDNEPICDLSDPNNPSCILEMHVNGERKTYVASIVVSAQNSDTKAQISLDIREDYR